MKTDNINYPELQKQRKRILNDWLFFHYRTTIGVVIFSFFVECIMSLMFVQTDILHTTLKSYILKFIVIPSGINLIIIIVETRDVCLKEFGEILKENAFLFTPYRYGGDEFCLLFYNARMQEAIMVCDSIRKEVEKLRIPESDIRLTVSIGLSEYDRESDAAQFFIYSDLALYNAKQARNSVKVYERGMAMSDL